MPPDRPPSDPRALLASAIQAVAGSAELDAALTGVLQAAVVGLGPVMGAIFLSDADRPGLEMGASYGMDAAGVARLSAAVADQSHPLNQAAIGRVVMFDRKATLGDGTAVVGAYLPLVIVSGGVDVTMGSIGFGWTGPRTLDANEREMVAALAGLAALAVDRARLASTAAERSEWFERMAHTDPLTGLANERTVGRILELELARAGRQSSEVSLAMFDVDDFQATNRDDGHEAGDDVLRQVAAVLAESVRLVDTVGRIGGDEFVLVAPGSAGAMVAERVLRGIAALPAVAGRSITVSAGVARFPVDGTDSGSLIAAAKEALLRARAQGRGTVAAGTTPKP